MKIGNPVNFVDNKPQQNTETAPSSSISSTQINRISNSLNTSSAANQPLSEQLTHPIASLTPYQNRWVIKARVMTKSSIRTWNNAKGEGKLFSMDLMDESGEIRCTAFKEMCDKYYDMIQV